MDLELTRRTAGLALRQTAFPARAEMLVDLVAALRSARADLVAASVACGATAEDAAHDAGRAVTALRGLANRAKRELPDDVVLIADEPWPAGRGVLGQRVLVSRTGVVLRPGAMGLPVTSTVAGIGRGVLAGAATVFAPAPEVAAAVRTVVALVDGVLPAGAVHVVSAGGFESLADTLSAGDVVVFEDRVFEGGTRAAVPDGVVVVSAPGSGWGVLGEDSDGSAFVRRLVRDVAGHAGARPGAAHRALVPEGRVEQVVGALREALDAVEVGQVHQPERVRAAAAALARSAAVVVGDVGDVRRPVVLVAEDPAGLPAVDPRGPVCTLVPYVDADDAARLLARGPAEGWVDSADPAFVAGLVRAGARLAHVAVDHDDNNLDRVFELMREGQVVADPTTVGAVAGQWVGGARTPVANPMRKPLGELTPGDSATAGPRVVTREDIQRFADLTGDHYYLHTDDEAAAANPRYKGVIAHGYLVLSLAAGLFIDPEPGPVVANYGVLGLRFTAPVHPGDALTAAVTCKKVTPRPGAGYGEVRWDVDVVNQNGTTVVRYDMLTLVAER
ncbi:aldehyde dehydrogenase family protein [Actinokineospora sp. G85]|uniref:aldehyde dehydrogenase family protein n=1 Tax=Actinokineospora sp. G85 TaxID=3406626 RepID=UPI003C72F740